MLQPLARQKPHALDSPTTGPEHGPTTPNPPIDAKLLFSHCMGNLSFALSLLRELESGGKDYVDRILMHAASGEHSGAADAAHSLKGAAAIFGAEPLSQMAAAIEVAGRDGNTSLVLESIPDLRREMERCLAYLPTLRGEVQQQQQSGSNRA